MRVAVTGAGGRLGSTVLVELFTHGYDVIAIDQNELALDAGRGTVETRRADLTDIDATRAALAGADVVLHLAAIPAPRAGHNHIVFNNNVISHFNVLYVAAKLGIQKVVTTSSQSALGAPWAPDLQTPRYLPVDEEHPCTPVEPYGLSKVVGEEVCEMFARRDGMRILSMRPPAVWIPDQFAERIKNRSAETLQGARVQWAYVDVRDAARAYRLAVEADWEGHEVVNITARWAFAAAPIPEVVREWYPELRDIRVELEPSTALFDWRKAERLLDFRARYRWTPDGIVEEE